MHPYLRIGPLTEQEYVQLRKWSASRKLSAGRVKRAETHLTLQGIRRGSVNDAPRQGQQL